MEVSKFITDVLIVPLIAFLIPIMWKLASIPIFLLREWFMQKNSLLEVELNLDIDSEIFAEATFKCLLVRFGTDQYIKDMASQIEKHDGRLRNKVINGSFRNGKVSYQIPLHKRIGTQFKCFLELPTKEQAEIIKSKTSENSNIYDLGISNSKDKNRIFFLTKDYATTETIDGMKNNMLFPI